MTFLYTDKRKLLKSQESIIGQTVPPSDYLVPVTSENCTELSRSATGYTISNVNNPTYVPTTLVQQLTMTYSTQQQPQQQQQQQQQEEQYYHQEQDYQQRYERQYIPSYNGQSQLRVPLPQEHGAWRKSDVFLHSYESIKSPHDYEDLTGSGNYDNPLTMTRNNAYVASDSYTSFLST